MGKRPSSAQGHGAAPGQPAAALAVIGDTLDPGNTHGVDGDAAAGHPASDEELALVAAIAHLTAAADNDAAAPPPPPLWPMLLHLIFDTPLASIDAKWLPASVDTDTHLAYIPKAVRLANCSVHSFQLKGLMVLRKIVSIEQNPPLQPVIDAGGIPIGARYLLPQHDEQPEAQLQALWLLLNIASGTQEQTAAVVDHPHVLHQIVRHLGSPSNDVAEQAVWAVGNIAGDGPALRDRLIECDAVPAVCALVDDPTKPMTIRGNAVWALSSLVRGTPSPPLERVKSCLPTLLRALRHEEGGNAAVDEVVTDALWALKYLTDTEPGVALVVVNDDDGATLRLIMSFLMHSNSAIVNPALRVIGNVFRPSNSEFTRRVVNAGFVGTLPGLLNHHNVAIAEGAAWTLSSILANNAEAVSFVLNTSTLMRDICTALVNESKAHAVLKELQWCVANAASGGSQVELRGMIAAGALDALFHCALSWRANGERTVALEGLPYLMPEATADELAPFVTSHVLEQLHAISEQEGRHATATAATAVLSLLQAHHTDDGSAAGDQNEMRGVHGALLSLVRGGPSPPLEQLKRCLPTLMCTLRLGDAGGGGVPDALWALKYLTDTEPGVALVVNDDDGATLRLIMSFLRNSNSAIVTPALRVIGNVCSSSKSVYTLRVVEAGFFATVRGLLNHPLTSIAKGAAWTLSNILAENATLISSVLNTSTLMRAICTALVNGSMAHPALRELQRCVANAASGSGQVARRKMIAAGALGTLFHCALSWEENDEREVALEGLTHLVPAATAGELARFATDTAQVQLRTMSEQERKHATAATAVLSQLQAHLRDVNAAGGQDGGRRGAPADD